MSKKNKIFRDPVHGYIAIDEDIIDRFIDTPQFQRLRRIKQTNLDVLFPAANQTRFEHSLGVYFLGRKLFSSILENCPAKYNKKLEKYQYTVEMACLLHDIGHAPMSHIGEIAYDKDKIIDELKKEGIKIETDLASHEMMSVLVGLRVFGEKLKEGGNFDKDLFFRLITGSNLNSEGCKKLTDVKKAVIPILNSVFDVDKMDYIMRDSSSAGIPSIELDIDRIINSATLVEYPDHKLVIAFGKSGFSVVTAIINNRNYMFKWIYGHHKVQYQYQVLVKFIKKLCDMPDFIKLFSYEAITGTPINFAGVNTSYTDDHDLWHIFKNVQLSGDSFKILREQLFERNHYRPFWKTKIEFDEATISLGDKLDHILTKLDTPDDFLKDKINPHISLKKPDDILMFKHDPKIVFPKLCSDMYFYLENKNTGKSSIKTYKELFKKEFEKEDNKMFHIFIKKNKYSSQIYKKFIKTLSNL